MDDKKIVREGKITLGENVIDCYILKDGTRVLSTLGIQRALGLVDSDKERSATRLSRMLSYKTVKSFVSGENISAAVSPFDCYKGNQKISGYNALVLPDFCEIMLKVRDNAAEHDLSLGPRMQIVIRRSDVLMRALSRIGIIALIDEATGYQYEREQFALNAILQVLVSDEILEYQKQFQLSFYKEIYRLWNIPFTEQNIRHKPSFIGHLTNRYIYSNLPAGTIVLSELKKRTPKTAKGNYRYKLHQSLTEDAGREALKKVLYSVEALASVSRDKQEFDRLVNERYGQKTIPFPDFDLFSKEDVSEKQTSFDRSLKTALDYNPKDHE